MGDANSSLADAYQEGMDRIGMELDGVAPPDRSPPPAPPVATIASTTVAPPPSPAPAGPGLGDRLAEAARGFGGAITDFVKGRLAAAQAAPRAPATPSRPAVPVAAETSPGWLPWAILGGAVLLVVALVRR